jgi:hypothetical protein
MTEGCMPDFAAFTKPDAVFVSNQFGIDNRHGSSHKIAAISRGRLIGFGRSCAFFGDATRLSPA